MGDKNYKDLLKHENLKNTKHREAVLKILENSELPMNADQLFMKLKEQGVSISLSTVYRVLETMAAKGLVIRGSLPDENKAVYELNREDHKHYLLCMKCHRMVPVGNCPLEDYEKLLEERFGFTIKGHKLEVFGYCGECAKKMSDDEL